MSRLMQGGLALVVLVLVGTACFGQPVRFSGSLSLTGEQFSASESAPAAAYRPTWNGRLFARSVVSIGRWLEIPLELQLSTQERRFQGAPGVTLPGLQPFNQVGISPRIGPWLRLHLGSFTRPLTPLTLGGIRVRGAGMELTPGPLRLVVLYGRTRSPREADLDAGLSGSYARNFWAVQVGIQQGATEVLLTVSHQKDDTTRGESLRWLLTPDGPVRMAVAPQENTVASLQTGLRLGRYVRWRSEVAVGAFSRDLRSDQLEIGISIPSWLFTPRHSSNIDGAAEAELTVEPASSFSLALGGRWIGPGYTTLGQPQLESDVLDLTVAPRLQLRRMGLVVSMRGGLRYNNLRQSRLATTARTIVAVNLSWQPGTRFGLDAAFSNYGFQLRPRADTLRLQNISRSLSLTPRLMLQQNGHLHTLSLTYSFQDSEDRTFAHPDGVHNRTHTLTLAHSYQMPSRLRLSTTLSFSDTRMPRWRTRIWAFSEAAQYPLRSGLQLQASAGLSRLTTVDTATQLMLRWGLRYQLPSPYRGTLSLDQQLRRTERAAGGFSELLTVLRYVYTW
ncbi:hypothetical protein ABUL39_03335 [Rhodothermus marinus]|uniref:hypothetical protein n=1 Tax=Rhodothermus marinus TaxID=29549 RepID=UPI0037CC5EFF